MVSDNFSSFHPSISFFYFVLVIGCSMFVMHPVFLGISCVSGFLYYLYLKQWKAVKTALWLMLPVFLVSAAVNPLFNHEGVTLICYFGTGNPLTLESIVYGFASGVMLVTVLNWFSCYQSVMTSDKFIYLFGKIIPALSLILSMVLRFVPKFKLQIQKVCESQKCIGRDVTHGNVCQRARHGMRILSIMLTWALENSVETADSMRSRGYGLRGRNNFSIYRFDTRDKTMLGILTGLSIVVFTGVLTKQVRFLYYPMLKMNEMTPFVWIVYIFYGILCFIPLITDWIEDIKWHYLKSRI